MNLLNGYSSLLNGATQYPNTMGGFIRWMIHLLLVWSSG
uniref:Uncharacterized protein n=1 Tax=Picea glauca TaxID=3330 RepID=A0A101LZB6_PICGL|nr:hypothetical protein ABT39_MTgene5150 [Picea glauca]